MYGFGGNGAYIADVSNLTQTSAVDDLPGRTGGGCLTTGPFANLTVPMGPDNSTASTPHCLRRDFTAQLAMQTLNQSLVDWQLEAGEFAVYDRRVQALDLSLSGITTHGGGHFSVGGMVGEVRFLYLSCLFFDFCGLVTFHQTSIFADLTRMPDVQHVFLAG